MIPSVKISKSEIEVLSANVWSRIKQIPFPGSRYTPVSPSEQESVKVASFKTEHDETNSDLTAIDVEVEHEENHFLKKNSPNSFFSDEKGNLKFVNFICRHASLVFILTILICTKSANTIWGRLVDQNDQDESPITEDLNE